MSFGFKKWVQVASSLLPTRGERRFGAMPPDIGGINSFLASHSSRVCDPFSCSCFKSLDFPNPWICFTWNTRQFACLAQLFHFWLSDCWIEYERTQPMILQTVLSAQSYKLQPASHSQKRTIFVETPLVKPPASLRMSCSICTAEKR